MDRNQLFSIENLCFSYQGTQILKDITLQLDPGYFYGVVGPNGCGKTTFLDLLTGVKRPGSGTILLKGKPLHHYSKKNLSREMALVPQEFETGFGFTVEELIMMGRHPHMKRFSSPGAEDYRKVENALKEIGIAELKNRDINTLSGGQKQRTVVARALAQNTPVLFFDEATSNLDIKYTLQIFSLARKLVNQNRRTVIAVMHNLNLAAAFCDRLIFIKDGALFRHGITKETLSADIIEEVFDVQTKVEWNEYSGRQQVSYQYLER